MRKVLRDADSLTYWNNRWSAFEADDDEFVNMEIYPIKYVHPFMKKNTSTLEAGCGLGRIVKHYHKRGFNIVGCDYSKIAVKKLNESNPELRVVEADISTLPYEDSQFDNVFAMGVFHSIEDLNLISKGIAECYRCLKPGGHLVASVRVENFENRLIDKIAETNGHKGSNFHKWCFTRKEFTHFIIKQKFEIENCESITNVPFLNKFSWFKKSLKRDESEARSMGFELNAVGNFIYGSLKFFFPCNFGTTLVITATKTVR